jgi:hypothetical protein
MVVTTCALSGHSPFRTATWIHWDAYQYLDISRHGYRLSACFLPDGRIAHCGNAGWFPGYPWLIRLIALPGLDHAVVAIVLAWVFDLATIVLLWATFGRRMRFRAALALLCAAFAPGLIYDYAAFPLSMLAFLTVLYLWLLTRERWLLAGVTGFALVLTYPVGVAAPLAVTLWLLGSHRGVGIRSRIGRIAKSVLPSVLALLLLVVIQGLSTGYWDAYFRAQGSYGHTLTDPLGRTFHAIGLLFSWRLFSLANAPYAQTLLVTFAVASILLSLAFRCRTVTPFPGLFALWLLAAWVIPQAITGTSQYRGEAALLPMAILVRDLPRVLGVVIVAASIAVAVPIEILFLRNTLV